MASRADIGAARGPSRPGRNRGRRLGWLLGLALLLGVPACMNPSTPTDYLINLPGTAREESLRVSEPTLVVLQHGIWRSRGSLWRLERALRAHGYEVLNESYPGTRADIEQHAERLAGEIDAYLERHEGPAPRVCFVGHSMGGLVIRSYLQRSDAVEPWSCVFIGTPQRGATMAEKRRETFLFRLFMGDNSALQLAPDHPFHGGLGPVPCERVGVIFGGKGDGTGYSKHIPGEDDGRVGAEEAQLPEQTASVGLKMGHTRLSLSSHTIRQVLHFLTHERFEPSDVAWSPPVPEPPER